MRKSLLLTALFLVFSFMGFAQEWHGITSDSPTAMKKTLVSSTENEIVINVNLDGFYTQSVTTPDGKKFEVYVKDMALELEAGAPQLSYDVIPVMIGDMAEMNVAVVNSTYVDFENMDVVSSKGNFSRKINPDDVPYTYGEMYSQNAFWPASQVTLDAPYIIRDFRGQNIVVRPFAYNPVTKTLRVYTSMTIAMTKVSDNGENQKLARKNNTVKTTSEFKASYSRRFINFESAATRYPWVEDDGEMLVICADQFMAGMQPLVEWKNQSGRPTTLVSVSEVGGNNDNVIKSYITNLYNDPNHNLAYVLFVGDYEHITPHALSGERSDNWFGQVEGSDHYPEIFVGRFSAQTDGHVNSQVTKVIYYERDLQSNVTWGDKGMGIGYYGAGNGHYGEDDYEHIDFIRDTLLHYTYSDVIEHHGGSGGDASVSTISGTINQGISIINYCNHGSPTSWGVADYSCSDVNALTNDYMWPVVWSVACDNGKFDYGSECFAEAWMRATDNTTGVPTGAIGGMFSWESQPWIPPMYGQDEMINILTGWSNADHFNHTLAGASLNGNMDVIDKGGDSKCHDTWVLFGDPSLMVRTANPTDMNVVASPSVLMLGMTDLNITADADYAIATLTLDGEILATEKIINGQCNMHFPALTTVGDAELVIVGFNKVTYMGTVEVVPAEGAYMTVNEYSMSVDQANYGETIDMSINVKNVGVETANNIAVSLSTENEYLNITAAEGSIATINPDQTVTVDGFQFAVAANVPDGTRAQIDVMMTAGNDAWVGKVFVDLHAPVVVAESLTVSEDAVVMTFRNEGTAPFVGGELSFTSCSPDLVFTPDTHTFTESVAAGESIAITAPYSVDSSVEIGSTFEVAYDMTSGLFNVSDIFVVSYGAIKEDFESGTFGPNWTLSPTNPWEIATGGRGNYCAKSNNGGQHNSTGYMQLTVDVLAAGNMTFMYKVSSEGSASNPYDKLTFYMDGQQKGQWAGTIGWTEFTQAVTVGQHTFKWEYTKDVSVSSGEDCAWVDNIVFPPTNVYTFIDPATELEATVDGHNVALTWTASADAVSYVVKRNGETVATVTETQATDVVEESGVYKYSVYAVDANGSMSAPATAMVNVEFTGVEENEVILGVYPNPAESVLYINANAASYEYQMINSVGQVVMSGVANGNVQLNVNDLNNGVYFLKVIANGNAQIEKVVIK